MHAYYNNYIMSYLQIIICFFGGFSSLGLIATSETRHLLITKNISSFHSIYFEITTSFTINAFRVIFFILLVWDTGLFLSSGLSEEKESYFFDKGAKNKHKIIVVVVVSVLYSFSALLLSIVSATLGYYRDEKFANCCDEFEMINTKIRSIIIVHAIFKAVTYFCTLMMSLYSVGILYNSKCKWQDVIQTHISIIKWTHISPEDAVQERATKSYSPSHSTSCCCIHQWKGKKEPAADKTVCHNSLSAVLEDKLYCRYYNYIEVGRKTSLERNALRRWFVALYLVYLIFVLMQAVHIMKILSAELHEHSYLDMFSSGMNILVHFLAFFFPYYMGINLNSAHQNYHKEITNTYLGIEIVIDNVRYICKPGCYHLVVENTDHDSSSNTACLSTKLEDNIITATENKVGKKYKEYFKEALSVQTSVNEEFDFVPSFLNMSIPLDSNGYALAVLLTVVSIVLNFL